MQSNTAYSLPFFFAEDALNNGLSLDSIKGLLEATECAMAAPLSTKLCVEFLVDLYQLDQFTDNQQRTIAYSHVSGATFKSI